jgi:signal transduction histidine kinase
VLRDEHLWDRIDDLMAVGVSAPPRRIWAAARRSALGWDTWYLVPLWLATAAFGLLCVWPLLATLPWLVITPTLLCAGFSASGLLLWTEKWHRDSAVALVVAGLLWALGWVDAWGGGPWPLVATFTAPIALALAAWAMYRYPDPGLLNRRERRFLVVVFCWIIIGRLIHSMVTEPAWESCVTGSCAADAWWPTVAASIGREQFVSAVTNVGEATFAVIFLVRWFRRTRWSNGLDRRLMLPVASAGVLGCVAITIPAIAHTLDASSSTLNTLYAIESAVLLAIPISFGYAVLKRRLAGNAIGPLIQYLDRKPASLAVLEGLRTVLCDPSLRVWYWEPGLAAYLDEYGHVAPDGEPDPRRLLVPVTSSTGHQLALIDAHPSVGRHAELVDSVVAASRFALENAQLLAARRAQHEQIQASRLRIVEATMAERRKLERDLHDGAQQRLLALKTRVGAAQNADARGVLTPGTAALLADVRMQIGEALDELRDLARGLHPAILSQSGLAAAVEAVAEIHPLPVHVDLPGGRLPAPTEATAYFVVCEALTNAARHSGATRISVTGYHDRDHLVLDIRDDGRGGADPQGHGLTGLQDRVQAIGGGIAIASPPDQGTRLVAHIPCA